MVSLISGQRYFTFLYGHTKHNIYNREGGRKENKQTWTWVNSKHKKGEVCDTFLAFCELSRACIQTKFPQSHKECWLIFSCWPTQHLGPHILAVVCSLLLIALFCFGTFLPLLSSSLVGNLAIKPFVWVLRQNRQRDPLTGTHPQKQMPPIMSQ